MLRRIVIGLLIVANLCLLSVVLLSADAGNPEGPFAVYNITMKEYTVEVDGMEKDTPLQFEVGKLYELHFTNAGALQHEVLMGQNALVTDTEYNFHLDFERNLLDDVEVSVVGEMNGAEFVIGTAGLVEFEVNPGQELTISFTLPEDKIGDWQIGCFVSIDPEATDDNPGLTHFDLGMKLPVVVAASLD